jgi:CheY-like chemotaxis protein
VATAPPGPVTVTRAGGFSGQVLVVDDEPAILETARAMLESLGLGVATAANGLQAMDYMAGRGAEVSLVLLDLTMPQMDGRQTLRALRRLRPGLPVILASGYDPRLAPAETREFDGRAFLRKPYTLEQLQRALAVALGPDPVII